MIKKVDERYPQDFALKYWTAHASSKTPWDKLVSFHDMMHFKTRFDSVLGSAVMQAFRIAYPDYVERTKLMCETFYEVLGKKGCIEICGVKILVDGANVHPFFKGNFSGALGADAGDERNMMPGRVNDFGTYRVEKELDVCPWDIVGSELCRSTVYGLQGMCDSIATCRPKGPELEYNMVEALGCGHRHCRVVAESREKWPMPDKPIWDRLGPIATDDRIKFTPDEECLTEPMCLRKECDYRYASGTNYEADSSMLFGGYPVSTLNLYPAIVAGIQRGLIDEKVFDYAQKCVCEAAGKAAFGNFFAKDGLRSWLGVPREIGDDDGRILGGYIEMYIQSRKASYEVEAFNKDEVIYVIDRNVLADRQPKYIDALVAYWYGMSKTLINAQWSLWEEDSPEGKLRIKIAKKIDKFC